MKKYALLLAFLAVFGYATGAVSGMDHSSHIGKPKAVQENERAKDLVCGMDVDPATAKYVYEYKGKKYYFCMKEDMEKFKKNPEKYLKKK